MTLATILRNGRLRKKMTLRAVAAETGISNPLISQIETGRVKNPGLFTVLKLARFYRITPLAIFSAKE